MRKFNNSEFHHIERNGSYMNDRSRRDDQYRDEHTNGLQYNVRFKGSFNQDHWNSEQRDKFYNNYYDRTRSNNYEDCQRYGRNEWNRYNTSNSFRREDRFVRYWNSYRLVYDLR